MPVFNRTKRWLIMLSCLLLSSILFAACGENSPSILQTNGTIAQSEAFVFWAILIIAVIVFVLVEGLLVFSIIRFRERPGAANPRQLHGDMRLELLWTVIPTLFLFVILFFTIRGLFQVSPDSEPQTGPKVSVTAIGHQWWWEFYYQDYRFTTADTLVIPTNTTIHVDLFSNNVIHSFWVPQLTGKTDLVPGHNNTKWFDAFQPGTFTGICAEYCGSQHANMKFNVRAVDNDTFQTWLHTQQSNATTPAAGSQAEKGLQVFKQACTSCHGIVGVSQTEFANTRANCNTDHDKASDCLLGPNLTHFGARNEIAGGVLDNNKDQCDPTASASALYQSCNLAKWLHDPQAVKPGNDMNVTLTDDQVKNLVAYLESLQ